MSASNSLGRGLAERTISIYNQAIVGSIEVMRPESVHELRQK